jgi:hypothetical protein
MKPSGPVPQWTLLVAAGLAAFLVANHLAGRADTDEAAPALVTEAAAQTVASTGAPREEPPRGPAPSAPARAAIDLTASQTFASTSWNPPPPAPVVQAPPPPPSAPPLPFRFIGMLEGKGDEPVAFIAKGESLHMIRAGDIVEGAYRIESMAPTQIVFTYLPLDQRQMLAVAGGQP